MAELLGWSAFLALCAFLWGVAASIFISRKYPFLDGLACAALAFFWYITLPGAFLLGIVISLVGMVMERIAKDREKWAQLDMNI